jgi:hypothetical protein
VRGVYLRRLTLHLSHSHQGPKAQAAPTQETTLKLEHVEATQPKRTMLLTVHEFMKLSGNDWSHGFSTRVGKRAGKLYREVMGRAPRKRRLKIAGRNATCAFPQGILEQAFAQVQDEIVAMADKLGIDDWVQEPHRWPSEGLRARAEDAADVLQAKCPGLTRASALQLARFARGRKPAQSNSKRTLSTYENLRLDLLDDIADAVKAEFGSDLTNDELGVLVRRHLRLNPDRARTLAELEVLSRGEAAIQPDKPLLRFPPR